VSQGYTAATNDANLLWVGVLIQAACAVTLLMAQPSFVARPRSLGRMKLGKGLSTAVLVGSLLIGFAGGSGSSGTERGRTALAADLQERYERMGLLSVHVRAVGLELRIESTQESGIVNDSVELMHRELVRLGATANVWQVGFTEVVVTNGETHRVLRPTDSE
jgi:hypothetical protein